MQTIGAKFNQLFHGLLDRGVSGNISFVQADAEKLPFPDNHFDCVTIAFGLRNVTHKDAAIASMLRVLKPGGRTVFAEIVLRSELPQDVPREIDDWFRCIGGALVQPDFLGRMLANGLANPRVLSLGRNARTGHELSMCAVIRAEKP